MDKTKFNILQENEQSLKIDKDLIEIQNTIIHYGENIILEIDKLGTLVRTLIQQKDREKKSIIIDIEKQKEKKPDNIFIRHLEKNYKYLKDINEMTNTEEENITSNLDNLITQIGNIEINDTENFINIKPEIKSELNPGNPEWNP